MCGTVRQVVVKGGGVDSEASFAVVLRERKDSLSGVLMILESRKEADEMAFELRRRHLDVIVMGWQPPDDE